MKKLIYIIVIAITSATFAKSLDNNPTKKTSESPAIAPENSCKSSGCEPGRCEVLPPKCCDKLPCGYCDNIPNPCCDFLPPCINCNVNSNSPRRGVNLQLIFAQPQQDGLDYVINNSLAFGSNSRIVQPDFNWFVGAKGGIEYTYFYDRWNLSINGMAFAISEKDRQKQDVVDQTDFSETFNSMGLIPVWNHPASYNGNLRFIRYSFSKAKWEQQFYSANIMLGKKFCISRQISFLPSFGLNNLIIFNDFKVQYKNGKTFPISEDLTLQPLSSLSKNEQDTYGIGPRVGVDTMWYFCPNVNFFAKAYGSLLYTYFYSERHDINNYQILGQPISKDEINIKHNFSSIKPAVELLLGITYEHCIVCKNQTTKFIRFSFGYGINYFWKQNQLIQFDDDVNDGSYYSLQGDLHMQEVNVGITCLF